MGVNVSKGSLGSLSRGYTYTDCTASIWREAKHARAHATLTVLWDATLSSILCGKPSAHHGLFYIVEILFIDVYCKTYEKNKNGYTNKLHEKCRTTSWVQRLSQDNRIKQRRAWLMLGWVTAERSCPCKQLACLAIGGGWKSPLSRWSPVKC
ncbi:hypothetical protein J6590_052156 [Homalodisca vitripennis]|nr:hypothetical protein J6590_052156 [Homalodisca vitripennis]